VNGERWAQRIGMAPFGDIIDIYRERGLVAAVVRNVQLAQVQDLLGSRTRLQALTSGSGCAFVLVDQPSQYRLAPDPLVVEVLGGVIGSRRDKSQCSMWPY
jgi:hypothetical protein